jgi:hypothetical protein
MCYRVGCHVRYCLNDGERWLETQRDSRTSAR